MANDQRVFYNKAEYIETVSFVPNLLYRSQDPWFDEASHQKDTGNKVSKKSTIIGSQNIVLGGKTIIQTGAVIRGDLRRAGTGHAMVVAIGKYCLLGEGCVIRPPYKTYKG